MCSHYYKAKKCLKKLKEIIKHRSLLLDNWKHFHCFFLWVPQRISGQEPIHSFCPSDRGNHIPLILVNKITVSLLYIASRDSFFLLNNIISPMIVNIYSDFKCQMFEHIVPLLRICLLELRASTDKVQVPGFGESCWQNLCQKSLSGGSCWTGQQRYPSEESPT